MMTNAQADALVFFGATGDLAYKKIFPSLQAMVKRGHLDVPVIGVAKSSWTLEQLTARAKESLETHGGLDPAAFDRLCGLLRYVDGDYKDPQPSRPFAPSSAPRSGPHTTCVRLAPARSCAYGVKRRISWRGPAVPRALA